jgi:hypothetical protein
VRIVLRFHPVDGKLQGINTMKFCIICVDGFAFSPCRWQIAWFKHYTMPCNHVRTFLRFCRADGKLQGVNTIQHHVICAVGFVFSPCIWQIARDKHYTMPCNHVRTFLCFRLAEGKTHGLNTTQLYVDNFCVFVKMHKKVLEICACVV